jgi:hypothetical protein
MVTPKTSLPILKLTDCSFLIYLDFPQPVFCRCNALDAGVKSVQKQSGSSSRDYILNDGDY